MFNNNSDCYYYYKLFNDIIGNRLQGLKWIIKKSSVSKYNIKNINYWKYFIWIKNI